MLVVATDVVQAPNDKQQIEPTLKKLDALPSELGETEHLLADTGYFSEANVEACEKAGVEPVIAMGRQPHHPPLNERFEAPPQAPEPGARRVEPRHPGLEHEALVRPRSRLKAPRRFDVTLNTYGSCRRTSRELPIIPRRGITTAPQNSKWSVR
jgi:hypothetical protein